MAVNFPSLAWIPVGIIIIIGLGFCATEMSFFADVQSNSILDLRDSKIIKEGDCFILSQNYTEYRSFKQCKSDYGFLGWKQWTNEHEEELIESSLLRIINPAPQKIIVVPEGSNFNYNLGEP